MVIVCGCCQMKKKMKEKKSTKEKIM